MKSRRLLNLIVVAVTALAGAALLLFFLLSGAGKIPEAKETEGLTDKNGVPVAAVSILDLKESNYLTRANYTPNEFLDTSPASSNGKVPFGTPVTLSQTKLAEKGTLRFVILNIDPWAENFSEQKQSLSPYLGADNNWHFSLYLPPVFSACTVYVRSALVAASGMLSDYRFIDFSEYNFDTEGHKDGTEPFILDLNFTSRRETILADRLTAAVTVTIHYESAQGKETGIIGTPVIGAPDAVERLVSREKVTMSTLIVVSSLSLAVFIFLCFLKKSIPFLPQPLMTLGVLGVILSKFSLTGKTALPYVWHTGVLFAFSFILLAAYFALRVKWRKFPVWLLPAAFALVNCVIAFVSPFTASSAVLNEYLVTGNLITACILLVFAAVSVFYSKSSLRLINPVLAGITTISAAFCPIETFIFINPVLWLFCLMIIATIVISFTEFVSAEKRNRYLTANLAEEVERQLQDLNDVIAERNKLLLYVSHDMKKPVVFIENTAADLTQHTEDKRILAGLKRIRQKSADLKKDFAELSHFNKTNYFAELSVVFNAAETVRAVCEEMRPDCEANNIVLTVSAPSSLNVFAKKDGLTSVIVNLILNAIEHSHCTHLFVSAYKRKELCYIDVTDNGTGIATEKDVFLPYLSGDAKEENSGLGLYLARTALRSMGGEIKFSQADGKLTFTVTLPIA